MLPHGSRKSSRTRSLPRDGPSSGGQSVNHHTASRDVSSERASFFKEFGQSVDPTHRRPVSSSPLENGYRSESEGSRSGNDTHGGMKSRGRSRGSQDGYGTDRSTVSRDRSRGSKSGYGSDGTIRSRTRNDLHSNSDSANRSGRAQSQKPRSSSQASSTRSKRAESATLIPGQVYREYDVHSEHIRLGKEAIPPDHGRRAGSKSRQETPERGRSTNSHKTTSARSVSSDEVKHSNGQLDIPKNVANKVQINEPVYHPEGEAAELCGDVQEEEQKIKRKPIRGTTQSRGANSRYTEPKLNHHRSGNEKGLSEKFSFEPIRQPPGEEQTRDESRDGAWQRFGGKDRTRNQISPADTNRGSAKKEDFLDIREGWLRGKSHPDSTPKGLVNQTKSTPKRYYAKNKGDPSPASDKGRSSSQHSEQYTPEKDPFAGYDAPPEKTKKKKEKSPSRVFRNFFNSWRT
ncbi:uncharacterized protein Bfra_010956 [Botrytis fragariae]|uniref:Uncharacterized protein n=1 Tax=Botrytis fragariae TaxID=1964551 RepID=A0A8H6ALF5_9HELO|nr:uncharacterized protein Bfra_010956 [Botrytis fragariae]KAF5869756.1 hypothetical protein Bfra_010956 [Botrytis fragariae]